MTEDEIRDLFRETADEPVPAESLERVRLAVAQRTRPRRGRAAALLAAAAGVTLLVLWLQKPAPVPAPPAPRIALQQAVPPLPAPVTLKPPLRAVARRQPKAGGNVVIRIETPDPDVVILLIGDE